MCRASDSEGKMWFNACTLIKDGCIFLQLVHLHDYRKSMCLCVFHWGFWLVLYASLSVLQITFLSLNPKFPPALQYLSFYFSVSLCVFVLYSAPSLNTFLLLFHSLLPINRRVFPNLFSFAVRWRGGRGDGWFPASRYSSIYVSCRHAHCTNEVCTPAHAHCLCEWECLYAHLLLLHPRSEKLKAGRLPWPEVGDPCNRMKVYYWAWKYWFCIGACIFIQCPASLWYSTDSKAAYFKTAML